MYCNTVAQYSIVFDPYIMRRCVLLVGLKPPFFGFDHLYLTVSKTVETLSTWTLKVRLCGRNDDSYYFCPLLF